MIDPSSAHRPPAPKKVSRKKKSDRSKQTVSNNKSTDASCSEKRSPVLSSQGTHVGKFNVAHNAPSFSIGAAQVAGADIHHTLQSLTSMPGHAIPPFRVTANHGNFPAGVAPVAYRSLAVGHNQSSQLSYGYHPGSVHGTLPPLNPPAIWYSGLSPHPYQLIFLPTNVKVCYGYGIPFTDQHRRTPHNLVIKHIDRRFIRRNPTTGQPDFSVDFQNTYYHLNIAHERRKNPMFNGKVNISLDLYSSLNEQQHNTLTSSEILFDLV